MNKKPIAFKYNDPVEKARWVFDKTDLRNLELEGAPLSYPPFNETTVPSDFYEEAYIKNWLK